VSTGNITEGHTRQIRENETTAGKKKKKQKSLAITVHKRENKYILKKFESREGKLVSRRKKNCKGRHLNQLLSLL